MNIQTQINAINQQFDAAFNSKNATAIAALYDANAVVMHDVARRISTTTTVRSLTLNKCIRSGLRQTSMVLIFSSVSIVLLAPRAILEVFF